MKNHEFPSFKDALCQDWLKLAHCFWRREFLHFVNVISLFCNYLPLEKSGPLHLNKLESPLPKDALCQVWLKLAKWFWRRIFFNSVNVFSLFHNNIPLEKGGALFWNKFESPHPRMLCAKFGWNWPSGSVKEDENVKSLRQQRRRTTDKFWSEKLTWDFGSDKLKDVNKVNSRDQQKPKVQHYYKMFVQRNEVETEPGVNTISRLLVNRN